MARVGQVNPHGRGDIRKDDIVRVTAGKDRGKQGKVLRVYPREGRLTVERVNMIKRHTRLLARGSKVALSNAKASFTCQM